MSERRPVRRVGVLLVVTTTMKTTMLMDPKDPAIASETVVLKGLSQRHWLRPKCFFELTMTVHVTMCSGTTPGGEQAKTRDPRGEIVGEMTPTVSVTTAASVTTDASALTAVTETVGMIVNPEVQLEVRRKVSQSSCVKLLFVLSQQGALCSW